MTMNTPTGRAEGQQRYAQLHQGADAVVRYQRKLNNRLDHLRDRIERELLAELLAGSVFDCTIGIGRFIGHLPQVTRYDGMDLSEEFVDHVRRHYPTSSAVTGNLLTAIPCADASYDNVICLRSLSGIGGLATILPEMVRITRPGGLIVLDYGRRATETHVKGVKTILDGEDLDAAIAAVDATEVRRVHVDAILTRSKAYNRLFRFLNGKNGAVISDQALLTMEEWLVPLLWQRQIVVLRRSMPASV